MKQLRSADKGFSRKGLSLKRFRAFLLILVFTFAFAILPAPGNATLEYYGIEDTINEDLSVTNVITLKFNETISHLDYKLNFDISNLQVKNDFESADCFITDGNTISCDFVGITPEKNQLTLTFDTIGGVKNLNGKYQFRANYGFLPTKNSFILIRLPQYSILSEEIANNSYFPPEGKIISDGKTIAVFWEMKDIGEESLQFSVSYFPPPEIPSFIIISLTILVIVVMVGVVVYARRKQRVEVITSVLNPDEKVIVDILKQKEGKALQKSLVRESTFSKAKVSRLVKDMKLRGIVEIEPVSGRENRILLSIGKDTKEGEGKDA